MKLMTTINSTRVYFRTTAGGSFNLINDEQCDGCGVPVNEGCRFEANPPSLRCECGSRHFASPCKDQRN